MNAADLKASRAAYMNGHPEPCRCGYSGPHWTGDRHCAHCGGLRATDDGLAAPLVAILPTACPLAAERVRDILADPGALLLALAETAWPSSPGETT